MARQRKVALDGIRGFAIFLVIINHLSYAHVTDNLTGIAKLIWNTIFLNGPFGVNVFFILCGFLMAYLYPKIRLPGNFVAKRYMRIFPLFFTVCTFNMIIFINKSIAPWIQLVTLILIAAIVHFVWMKYIDKKNYAQVVKKIITAFIALQLIMIVVNVAIGRLDASQFNHLPDIVRYSVIYLANLTLTLWAGWNIPILSGPYWSLAPEVLFYLVYPVVLLIFISRVKKLNWQHILLILIISTVSLLITNFVFNKVLALSRLNIVRSYAFVVGIVIALILQDEKKWQEVTTNFKNRGVQIATLCFIPIFLLAFPFFPESNQFNLNMLHIVSDSFMMLVFLVTLIEGTALNTFFSQKWLLFLGLISYPAYLIHSITISWLTPIFNVSSQPIMVIYTIAAFVLTIPVAFLLHYLVERPYFNNPTAHNFPVK